MTCSGACAGPGKATFGQWTTRTEAIMDVTSDIASKQLVPSCPSFEPKMTDRFPVMIIPATLIWKARLPMRKKFAIGGIFCLTVFVMAASLSRNANAFSVQAADPSWVNMASAIEMTTGMAYASYVLEMKESIDNPDELAIIVACIGSFRALFTSRKSSHGQRHGPSKMRTNSKQYDLQHLVARTPASIFDGPADNASGQAFKKIASDTADDMPETSQKVQARDTIDSLPFLQSNQSPHTSSETSVWRAEVLSSATTRSVV